MRSPSEKGPDPANQVKIKKKRTSYFGKRTNLSKSKLRKAWASLSQSVELVTALAIGHPSTNHLKKSSEPIDLSPGGKLQELQTERSEKERVVNEKSLAWPARKKDQHSRLLDKSVIRRIASRGGRPFSMLIEKSISELKGLVWPELRSEATSETAVQIQTIGAGAATIASAGAAVGIGKVDLPTEDQNDTINDLRDKCAILLESFSKNQSRDRFTWQDIAQRLVLEGKGTTAEVGATREDFQRLLGELKNPGESDVVYLRVLKALEKHRR
ncbi:hypothetical protein JHK87_051793 [Glycine soja]|nr:hypothetical protein JHK87_051793 [Glycine soja]